MAYHSCKSTPNGHQLGPAMSGLCLQPPYVWNTLCEQCGWKHDAGNLRHASMHLYMYIYISFYTLNCSFYFLFHCVTYCDAAVIEVLAERPSLAQQRCQDFGLHNRPSAVRVVADSWNVLRGKPQAAGISTFGPQYIPYNPYTILIYTPI